MKDRIWLGFSVGIQSDLFLDAGRKSLGCSVSIEIDLVFVWVVDPDLISVWWVSIYMVFCRGLK